MLDLALQFFYDLLELCPLLIPLILIINLVCDMLWGGKNV